MKNVSLLLLLISYSLSAQYEYEPTAEFPYGRMNPKAPQELADFAPMIGTCDCKSVSRIDPNNWADTVQMTWTFKYIMNGMAVQDETWKMDGTYAGSIRQYNADSSRWYVHYYTTAGAVPSLPSWEGNQNENGNIVLYRPQQAPNGMNGYFRLLFYNITNDGYDWVGAWVNEDETIVYPTWKIFCSYMK